MRNVRAVVGGLALVCSVLPALAESFATRAATAFDTAICDSDTPPPAGFQVKRLTSGNDELVLSPTDTQRYIVYGAGGNDDIVGGGGGDILCGGSGRDGLNGGPGADLVVGGTGTDFLVGAGGADTLSGGDGDDALYGGAGVDLLAGDAGNNYVQGGAGPNAGDADTAAGTCPPSSGEWYATLMGTYNPDRLAIQNPCRTLDGYVVADSKADPEPGGSDGDQHFLVQVGGCAPGSGATTWVVEFTPRDKPAYGGVIDWSKATCNNPISLAGAYVLDCTNHVCDATRNGKEIHPVFQVTYGGSVYSSGPRYGGSPWAINPSGDHELPRFCWRDTGEPCTAWTGGEPFD